MMIHDLKSESDLPSLFSDREGYSSAVKELCGMFDREVYDIIVYSGKYSGILAGSLADRMGTCVVEASGVSASTVPKGGKAIMMCDCLKDGKEQLEIIQNVESHGCKVIRTGFVIEDTSCGARKSKILKKYPFEALVAL